MRLERWQGPELSKSRVGGWISFKHNGEPLKGFKQRNEVIGCMS